MSEALNELASYLAEMRGALIASSDIRFGELTLTAKGQEEADIASEWFFAYEEGVGGTLTQAERDQLLFLLRKFIGI